MLAFIIAIVIVTVIIGLIVNDKGIAALIDAIEKNITDLWL